MYLLSSRWLGSISLGWHSVQNDQAKQKVENFSQGEDAQTHITALLPAAKLNCPDLAGHLCAALHRTWCALTKYQHREKKKPLWQIFLLQPHLLMRVAEIAFAVRSGRMNAFGGFGHTAKVFWKCSKHERLPWKQRAAASPLLTHKSTSIKDLVMSYLGKLLSTKSMKIQF